tara:strand:- start:43 stop:594 length:552 start_codon:yes stop_codon:yes gene_type:complete
MIGNAVAGLFGVGVTPSTTAYESIETVTVGGAGASSITFSSIAADWTHLQVRLVSFFTSARMDITFNSDSTFNYSYHLLQGDGSGTYAEAGSNQSAIKIWPNGNSSTVGTPNVAVVDILDYADTNKYKTARILNGFDQNGSGIVSLNSGNWRITDAITSIVLAPNTGNFAQYSQFALYGIKGA